MNLRTSPVFSSLTLASALVLFGCGGQLRRIEPPQIQTRVAEFQSADQSQLIIRLEMTAYNPNTVELSARGVNAVIAMGGQPIGTATVEMQQTLPPQAPLPLVLNLALPRAGLAMPPQMMGMGMGANAMTFTVTGTVAVVSPRGPQMNVPFTMQGTVPAEVLVGLMAQGMPPVPPG